MFGPSPLQRSLIAPRAWRKDHWKERYPCLGCGSRHHHDCRKRRQDGANKLLSWKSPKHKRTWIAHNDFSEPQAADASMPSSFPVKPKAHDPNMYRGHLLTPAVLRHENTKALIQQTHNVKIGNQETYTLDHGKGMLNHMHAVSRNIVFSKGRWLASMLCIPNYRGCTLQKGTMPLQCLHDTVCVHALVWSERAQPLCRKLTPNFDNCVSVGESSLGTVFHAICLFEGAPRSNNTNSPNKDAVGQHAQSVSAPWGRKLFATQP